ncbi:probable Xaa-Pro aminopeptidase P [Stegodyphus dumicola]|uniref:probable Xaa-Pro aminopeptidase P n=1 Tax=Stegodyphus dumicola TaxID=202533 RepID=UPI0015A874A2|nr:probable Xaa-Pro aminopeptidase P [Stegodyphus dumicola]
MAKPELLSERIFEYQTSKKLPRSISSSVRESCLSSNDIVGIRTNTTDRLRRLRLRMKASNYDAYIVPTDDEHQSEFVADHDKRREFITGFTGTAGTAVILQDKAALWTDGRYFIQAEKELDCNWLLMKRHQRKYPSVCDWLIQNLHTGAHVGADSKLIAYKQWLHLKEKLEKSGISLYEDDSNLIDDIWNIPQGRAPESVSHIYIHDLKYAGRTWEEKIKDLRDTFDQKMVDGLVIPTLDEISWLFNLRGSDVVYTPVFKAYAFVSKKQIRLYVKPLKMTPEVEKHLCPQVNNETECVQVKDYNKAFEDMAKLITEYKRILIPSSSSYAVVNLVPKEKRELEDGPSPVACLKVIKNSVEVLGMKNAALKDAVAIVDFMSMLEQEVKNGKHWDEMKAAKTLSRFRREQELNQGESFPAISAFGPNAAIIHYTPQLLTNRNINTKNMYLLDSGGQYLDGTTDITRTFHFGNPSEFEVVI